nr:MAG TPA: hypothetical protein [Caudoviricetes sp.]
MTREKSLVSFYYSIKHIRECVYRVIQKKQ